MSGSRVPDSTEDASTPAEARGPPTAAKESPSAKNRVPRPEDADRNSDERGPGADQVERICDLLLVACFRGSLYGERIPRGAVQARAPASGVAPLRELACDRSHTGARGRCVRLGVLDALYAVPESVLSDSIPPGEIATHGGSNEARQSVAGNPGARSASHDAPTHRL
jgi:hypothetical protein